MESLQTLFQNDRPYREKYEDVSPADNEDAKEEYWENYYHENDSDIVYEWNNGYLEVKPVSDQKGSETLQWFCDILRCYIHAYPLGRTSNLDIGFRLAIPGRVEIRKPDLAVEPNRKGNGPNRFKNCCMRKNSESRGWRRNSGPWELIRMIND